MPAGTVKTPDDEKKWSRAKDIVDSGYAAKGKVKKDSNKYWSIVNGIFQKMKKSASENDAFVRGFITALSE